VPTQTQEEAHEMARVVVAVPTGIHNAS